MQFLIDKHNLYISIAEKKSKSKKQSDAVSMKSQPHWAVRWVRKCCRSAPERSLQWGPKDALVVRILRGLCGAANLQTSSGL